jgi:hypothetical protein
MVSQAPQDRVRQFYDPAIDQPESPSDLRTVLGDLVCLSPAWLEGDDDT